MNTITTESSAKAVEVGSLPGGTFVRGLGIISDGIYIVLANRPNSARITAINIKTGGYIEEHALVIPFPMNTSISLLVNQAEEV